MEQIKSSDTPPDKAKLNDALMLASTTGDVQTLNQLLQMGADPNAENLLHMTALMSAANNIHPECVDALLKAGANPNVQDAMGATALMLATRNRLNYQSVRSLIKGGADINAQNKIGITALILAAENECIQCMYDLIKAGADVNVAESTNDLTPLLHAENGSGDPVGIKIQIDAGADVNAKTRNEDITPLHKAMYEFTTDVALLLLNSGANPNVTSKNGETPYSILIEKHFIGSDGKSINTLYRALISAKARCLFIF